MMPKSMPVRMCRRRVSIEPGSVNNDR